MERRNFLLHLLLLILAFFFGFSLRKEGGNFYLDWFNGNQTKNNKYDSQTIGDISKLGDKPLSLTQTIIDRAVNVKDFGASGDGYTNDTLPIQAALNALEPGQKLFFPSGTYMVSNLVLPNTKNIKLEGNVDSVIKKNIKGNREYLMASFNYVKNIPYASEPFQLIDVKLDGGYICDNVLIIQSWNTLLEKCEIRNGLKNGIIITANTKTGKPIKTTLVNNRIRGCLIHDNKENNINIMDTSKDKVTDLFITENIVYRAKVGVKLDTSAGTIFAMNHLYGHNDYDLKILFSSFGSQVVNNYFEGSITSPKKSVYIKDFAQNSSCIFSTNNVTGDVRVFSKNSNCFLLSTANHFRTENGVIKNNWNDNVIVKSTGDSFESRQPFLAVDKKWNYNSSSISKFIVTGSTTSYYKDIRNITGVVSAQNPVLSTVYANSQPTTGSYSKGSICYNTIPVAGGTIGWICVKEGSPGEWKSFGSISS